MKLVGQKPVDSLKDNAFIVEPVLDEAIVLAKQWLTSLALEADFLDKIKLAFETEFDVERLEILQQYWVTENFKDFPTIEIRSAQELGGANGAFSATFNQIYLSREYLEQNRTNVTAIANLITEEFGHFVDVQINKLDSVGDEGALFAALARNQLLSEAELVELKAENDHIVLNIDGKLIPAELNIQDQVLWSKRVGDSFSKNIQFGQILEDYLGIDNEGSYSEFFGIDRTFREFTGVETGKIGISGVLSGGANAELGIASSRNQDQAARFKAGLQIDAGYDAGGVEWNIPLYADAALKIENNQLSFDLDFDKNGAYFDLVAPYLFLNVDGIFEADAAFYLNGNAEFEYVDVFRSIFSGFKKKVNRDSRGFSEKVDLSFDLGHRFVDLDTRNDKQVIDYIFGRKEYEFGGEDLQLDLPPINEYLDIDFGLPNLNEVDLINIPTVDDSYKFRLSDRFELINFDFDIDAFIGPRLPIPTTFKDNDGFSLFGSRFGYDVNAALFDINLITSLFAGYEIDFGIESLLPDLEIEGERLILEDGSRNPKLIFDISSDPNQNSAVVGKIAALDRDNDPTDNQEDDLDFSFIFDPELSITIDAYVEPGLRLDAGLGKVSAELEIAGRKRRIDETLIDLGSLNLNDLGIEVGRTSLFGKPQTFKRRLSEINIFGVPLLPESLRRIDGFSLPIADIAEALGVNFFSGSNGPDYYAGQDGPDVAEFKDGPDVAQLSLGKDDLDGGEPRYPGNGKTTDYNAPFFNGLSGAPSVNDLFILDSDVISADPNDSDAALLIIDNKFTLGIGDFQGSVNNLANTTEITNFERVLFADELQSSERNVDFLFELADGLETEGERLYFGGQFPADVYASAATLPTGNLTGTQGSNFFSLPIGFNRGAPIVLGRGNDRVALFALDSSVSPNFNDSPDWRNPYDGESNLTLIDGIEGDSYTDFFDLGAGSNTINFQDALATIPTKDVLSLVPIRFPYSPLITSAAPGNVMNIVADATTTPGVLVDNTFFRLINLGGSTFLSADDVFTGSNNNIYSILSAGNNNFQLGGSNINDFELTLLLETRGLQSKFVTSAPIEEAKIVLNNGFTSTSINGNSGSITGFFDTQVDRLTLSSTDIVGSSTFREMGSSDSYSLESPASQTYEIGSFDAENILIRGRLPRQPGAFRKVILKDSLDSSTTLGLQGDIFDEIVFESQRANESDVFRAISNRFNTVDLTPIENGYDGRFRGFILSSIHELRLPELASNRLILSGSESFGFSNSELNGVNAKTFSPLPAGSDFFDTIYSTIAPAQTLVLGSGDDLVSSNAFAYEFIYPGGGNNIIVQTEFPNIPLNYLDPRSGEIKNLANSPVGDVVVYTEGNSSDYVIQKSTEFDNAVEVLKSDGTKDLLFGIRFIKFETEDVSIIPVTGSTFVNRTYAESTDIFDNDISNRLFVSQAIRPDGEIIKGQLDDPWAIDRIDLSQNIIRQPGSITNVWDHNIPVGLETLKLPKLFLLNDFTDADISNKGLYSSNDIDIEIRGIIQNGFGLDALLNKNADGSWNIEFPEEGNSQFGNFELDNPFIIDYVITEPEGYSHFVQLTLHPSADVNLGDLKSKGFDDLSTTSTPGSVFSSFSADISELLSNSNLSISASSELPFYEASSILGIQSSSETDFANTVLTGTFGNEIIQGGENGNQIYGGFGADVIIGGAGADYIAGQDGRDILLGKEGDDILDGGASQAFCINFPCELDEIDILDGGVGDDILIGGKWNDILLPGPGNNLVDGGEGADIGVSSGVRNDFKLRRRLDESVVSRDISGTKEELTLYKNVEQFKFDDITLSLEDISKPQGNLSVTDDGTAATISTEEGGTLQLENMHGSEFLSIDILALEDLLIDQVILDDALEFLEQYQTSNNEKFNADDAVLEFVTRTPENNFQEIISLTLDVELDVDTFIKFNPETGETFEFNYDPITGLGAELIDTNNNGLVDLVNIHVKDGGKGDADGEIDGFIYDPGLLAKSKTDPSILYVGGLGNDTLNGGDEDEYFNGFGPVASSVPQFDTLSGGGGSDTFILGGDWGASYFEKGDGYVVVTDWDPKADQTDLVYDRIGVINSENLGMDAYSLQYKAVGDIGSSAEDTEIYFTNVDGQRDRVAIIQDTTEVLIDRDFVFYQEELERDTIILGGLGDETLIGREGDDRLNGFGTVASPIPQFDTLTGGDGNDTFVLGGDWGVSYFEKGDGYAVVTDWNPKSDVLDSVFDSIEVPDVATLGGGFYSLEYKAVSGIGSNIQDTEIYFTDVDGKKDRIGIIQDTTDVLIDRDFIFG